MRVGEASTPPGLRVYAIGDVHGCDAMLAALYDRVAADLATDPAADHGIVHIGDYCDRGPDTAGVIERLVRLTGKDRRAVCLKGNHDELLANFLDDPIGTGDRYFANGGDATLRSYGVRTEGEARDYLALAARLAERMPAAHRAFLATLPVSVRFGDYFFCHAGIRPGVPLDAQDPDDLIWIRETFLRDPRDHGVVVIHGHTPVDAPEVRPNRIDIDTGAVYGGPLTCLVLDGTAHRFLEVAPG